MKKIIWNDEYCTGVDSIDKQHQKLVEIMGSFYDALMGNRDEYLVQRIELLKDLVDYTVYHFHYEEKLFEEINYYAKVPHALQHSMFVNQVGTQVEDLLQSDIEKGAEFYDFLMSWLLTHISKSDKLFCQKYLSTN